MRRCPPAVARAPSHREDRPAVVTHSKLGCVGINETTVMVSELNAFGKLGRRRGARGRKIGPDLSDGACGRDVSPRRPQPLKLSPPPGSPLKDDTEAVPPFRSHFRHERDAHAGTVGTGLRPVRSRRFAYRRRSRTSRRWSLPTWPTSAIRTRAGQRSTYPELIIRFPIYLASGPLSPIHLSTSCANTSSGTEPPRNTTL